MIEPADAVPDTLHGFIRSVINMFFVCVSLNLYSQAEAQALSDWMEEELGITTTPVWNQASREFTKKTAQTWNGKECWQVLTNISNIMDKVFPPEARDNSPAVQVKYDHCGKAFSSFVELLAVWTVDVPNEEHWPTVAAKLQVKAKAWTNAFVQCSGSTVDCTPTMHSIIYHYSLQYARHGPLVRFCTQGLEAKHQPVKRAKTRHANGRNYPGVGKPLRAEDSARMVHATSTDIMQVTRRVGALDKLRTALPSGKGTRKRTREQIGEHDALSAIIKEVQVQLLAELPVLDADPWLREQCMGYWARVQFLNSVSYLTTLPIIRWSVQHIHECR